MDNEFGFDAYDDYDVDELIDGMGSDFDDDALTLPEDELFENA